MVELKILPMPQKTEVEWEKVSLVNCGNIKKVTDSSFEDEAYRLEINSDGVTSYANSVSGHYYAGVTLEYIRNQFEQVADNMYRIPKISVTDRPTYKYRGYMLDVSRHFFGVETIKKHLDIMALLKLNVFHWHLTDDQGFRFESEKYPEITEKGRWRPGTSGDNIPVEGFYTKAEIREIVAYAKERCINVLPEIDLPGHSSVILAAHPEISCDGETVAVKELFGIHKEVCCAGKEKTYEILKNLLIELFELFPYEYIHLGGDEALRIKWVKCPDCQSLMERENLKNEDELQAYFMGRLVDFCKQNGKRVINWNDGLLADNIDKDVIVHYWHETAKSKDKTIEHINEGSKAIMSPFYSYYLDYPYGMTPLKKSFMYNPVMKGIKKPENIIGVEAPLWTEYIKTEKQLEFNTYPRLLVVSERGWSAWHEDYIGFRGRVDEAYKLFDRLGLKVNYAPLKKVDLKVGTGKLISLAKFAHNFCKKSAKVSMGNMNENKRILAEKYKGKNK